MIERLTERRIQVEKAVNTLGEAPSGLKDVFELCRGFERAFSNIVNVRDVVLGGVKLCCCRRGAAASACLRGMCVRSLGRSLRLRPWEHTHMPCASTAPPLAD